MAKLLSTGALDVLYSLCGVSYSKMAGNAVVCNSASAAAIVAHLRFSSVVGSASLIYITGYSSYNNNTVVLYHFNTVFYGRTTIVTVLNAEATIKTIRPLYYNAWWYERELSEMFGVTFKNSTDSRNLLLPYGNADHPLKKTVQGCDNTLFLRAAEVAFVLKNML